VYAHSLRLNTVRCFCHFTLSEECQQCSVWRKGHPHRRMRSTASLVVCDFKIIDYLRIYVPLKNFSLIWRRHHARRLRPLSREGSDVTRDLGFSSLIRRTAPFSRLLRQTRGCGGSILTRILTGRLPKTKKRKFTPIRIWKLRNMEVADAYHTAYHLQVKDISSW
jgi:hypothetical protein